MLALALFLAAQAQPGYALDCTYRSRTQRELVRASRCATIDRRGTLSLAPALRRDLAYDPRTGLAQVYATGWYYLRRDGRSAPVMTYDNDAEGFRSNRARSPRGGRIGYIDRTLGLAIPARFDGALPFAGGRAQVCFGCTLQSDGEHQFYTGGLWTCIDPQGRERGPRLPQDQRSRTCG